MRLFRRTGPFPLMPLPSPGILESPYLVKNNGKSKMQTQRGFQGKAG
jgi:hypothetical protein